MYGKKFMETFNDHLHLVEDPRMARTREHPLPLLVFCAIGSCLTGGASFTDMALFAHSQAWFLAPCFGMKRPPCHDTFNRLFQALDPKGFNAFIAAFSDTLRPLAEARGREMISIDGKSLRRSASPGIPALHILNAWSAKNRLVIGQIAVDDKSNETTAMPEMLASLDIKGSIVTADALHTQKETARQIVEQGADYILPLKGNHPLAEEEVRAFMEPLADAAPPRFQTVEKDHGRLETRRIWQSDDIKWFADAPRWKGLKTFSIMRRTREFADGRKEESQHLYLSSLAPDAELAAEALRAHWGVENQCHWCLDVLFGEDQSRARTGNAARNLSSLRKLCMNISRNTPPPHGLKNLSLRSKRYLASISQNFLLSNLAQMPVNKEI